MSKTLYVYNRDTGKILIHGRYAVQHEAADDGGLKFFYGRRTNKHYLDSDQISDLRDAIIWLRERGAEFDSAVSEFARTTPESTQDALKDQPERYFGDMGFLKWLSNDEYFAGPWKYRFSDQGDSEDGTLYDIVMNPETDEYRYTIIVPLARKTYII